MMKKYLTSLLILSITALSFTLKKEKTCQITGTVLNSETKSILLVKPNQNMTFDKIIEIPVVNGKFHFETKLKNPETVNLFLGEAKDNGGGRYMRLFLENEKIVLTIYPENDFDKNIIQGGRLNAEYSKYNQAIDLKFRDRYKLLNDSVKKLHENKQYNSIQMNEVLAELDKSKSQDENIILYKKMDDLRKKGLDKMPQARILSDKLETLRREVKLYEQSYILQNPTIVSYAIILNNLIFDKENVDIDLARDNCKKLSKANPGHPYNVLTLDLINAIDNIKIGKNFKDFSAPDLKGNIIRLSDQIKGKVALLDLWATWCGPCIARSKTMLSVYDKYKDKGFTIIGVAGEFKNTTNLTKFLEREKWPWLNLVELDRKNNIWQKYNIQNSGGAIFLIDRDGKIIAKDPSADEVKNELEKQRN
ncbi:TlpA disulfide reductase family protein [Pedobacter nyackensis]|uniref:TlpA disulfide reductase family protein n=1 Tax=Pedobacter nyackensis TaxID=475255 RepID=UPI002930BE2E|nr:TlpA disulfide reductase family protein [Pedobacter nyackensis]